MKKSELKDFLNEKYLQYNNFDFIDEDPVKIPHLFSDTKDIEISGLFAAVLAWGNRKSIIKNATSLIERMDNNPSDFIKNFEVSDHSNFDGFVHRTFQKDDVITFCYALQNIYKKHQTLGHLMAQLFTKHSNQATVLNAFKSEFFNDAFALRSTKHLPNPLKGSAGKRLCMYFRWMTRKDGRGVDLGIWNDLVPTSKLHLPLDVHTGNVGRTLKLLNIKQNNWKAVEEITKNLTKLDPQDPTKYDFALFGLGVNNDL